MTITYEDREIEMLDVRAIVALDGDVIAGSLHYRVLPDGIVETLNLVVAGRYRNQGIAHALCAELVSGPMGGKVAQEWRIGTDGVFTSGATRTAPIPLGSRGFAEEIIETLRTNEPGKFVPERDVPYPLALESRLDSTPRPERRPHGRP